MKNGEKTTEVHNSYKSSISSISQAGSQEGSHFIVLDLTLSDNLIVRSLYPDEDQVGLEI
jgi:hypothetical protein